MSNETIPNSIDPEDCTESEAAAALMALALEGEGVVDDVFYDGDNIVAFATHGDGIHLGNYPDDYDYDIHLICDPDGVDRDTNYMATVYANAVVDGLQTYPEGWTLPTHSTAPDGTSLRPRDALDDEIWEIAAAAGLVV